MSEIATSTEMIKQGKQAMVARRNRKRERERKREGGGNLILKKGGGKRVRRAVHAQWRMHAQWRRGQGKRKEEEKGKCGRGYSAKQRDMRSTSKGVGSSGIVL